MGLHE